MALTHNQRGALFMVISQIAFIINDTLTKIVAAHLGVGQIMAVRGLFASTIIVLLVWRLGHMRPMSLTLKPVILLRMLGEMGATVAYLIALSHLPIANVSALFQSLPLVVTMSAALFFGEKVGPRRWLAITAGFIGILLIVRPGLEGFSTYSIYVIICVFCCALRDLATRRVPDHVPSMFISMLTAVAVTICGVLIIPFSGGWAPMATPDLAALLGAAIILLTGYQFVIQAMRVGDISFVAPFRYTNLLWAIGIGILVFGDLPDLPMIIGSAIVVASGIYSLYRERVVGRGRPIAESTASAIAADGV
ncbi:MULTISPECIES: DMT family transporter [Mesorhizobium]|uniref:DMT family transporter n=1 Tax=Mesorhizobium denitrificans TaxID=2294114 RepID=A0A371XDB6_9HYPH|nr:MULTISPECIES: DMT family transporter [Mesorhizobium]RFC67215.1 DMT family transporter [Mesorhizobium denitrificans]